MAATDAFTSPPAVVRPVGFKKTLSMTRDERCPFLLLPQVLCRTDETLDYVTRVQAWPVSRMTKRPHMLLEICRSEFWHKEIILCFGSDARRTSSSLDNDSAHLLIQQVCGNM